MNAWKRGVRRRPRRRLRIGQASEPDRVEPHKLVVEAGNMLDMLVKQKKVYASYNGRTERKVWFAPGPKTSYAQLTLLDVARLYKYWNMLFLGRRESDEPRDISEGERWGETAEVAAEAATLFERGGQADEMFPAEQTAELWNGIRRMAIYLSSLEMRPTTWELIKESTLEAWDDAKKRLKESLPTIPWKTIGIIAGLAGATWLGLEIYKIREAQ